MPAPDTPDDEFTELVDARFPRVDLVGKAANGIPRFLIAKSDQAAGVLDPAFVRDLISKSTAPDTGTSQEGMITVSGTPSDVAALINSVADAAVRKAAETAYPNDPCAIAKAAYDQVVKAKYTAEQRREMAKNGQAMPDGSYPIGDEEDLKKAVHAVGRGGDSHNAIRKHIIKRARALGKTSLIPDDWGKDGEKTKDVKKADLGDSDLDLDDDGPDSLDASSILAAPDDDDVPGDPQEPGSAAWEAIDAATAEKWLGILARTKVALATLSDREGIEAAAGDSDDAENAYDLQDACGAIDFVIGIVAPYAVSEQSESDTKAVEAVAKAMQDFDEAPLTRIEALAAVAKAGRVLSSANEQEIRSAAASLQKVLASLPAAPIADDVTKEATMPNQAAPAGSEPVSKADDPKTSDDAGSDDGKQAMQAVFDQNGNLVGVVPAEQIVPVAGTDTSQQDTDGTPAAASAPADAEADGASPGDLTPQPPADAGTPAGDADGSTGDDVTKSNPDQITISRDVLKGLVTDAITAALEYRAAPQEDVAKTGVEEGELAETVRLLKARVDELEQQPAVPKVFFNGQAPVTRDGQQAGPQVDVAKARELRSQFTGARNATEQNDLARVMQTQAIEALASKHRR